MEANNLNTLLNIAEIVLFVTLTILAIYLIISMKKFLYYLSNIEKEVIEISDSLTPVISDMRYITEDVKMMVDKSRIQFDKIENLSEALVDKGTGVLSTITKIQNVGNGYVSNAVNLISAFTKGFNTFKNKIKKDLNLVH